MGYLYQNFQVAPFLVVVPNSTITNWVREFERWAPALRAVPYCGEHKSREIIRGYELYHEHPAPGTVGLKFHVLITTYDTITSSKDSAAVFRSAKRWECLIVDEVRFYLLNCTSSLTGAKCRGNDVCYQQ